MISKWQIDSAMEAPVGRRTGRSVRPSGFRPPGSLGLIGSVRPGARSASPSRTGRRAEPWSGGDVELVVESFDELVELVAELEGGGVAVAVADPGVDDLAG